MLLQILVPSAISFAEAVEVSKNEANLVTKSMSRDNKKPTSTRDIPKSDVVNPEESE